MESPTCSGRSQLLLCSQIHIGTHQEHIRNTLVCVDWTSNRNTSGTHQEHIRNTSGTLQEHIRRQMRHVQVVPTLGAKETYYRGKRDLLQGRQMRHVQVVLGCFCFSICIYIYMHPFSYMYMNLYIYMYICICKIIIIIII